ncbi:MAG: prepilin-type N-terminal cleavage/methylation domain-containing protein [Nitrospirae bacterium]|nr:prepilin-type N-terminal cleavage/methylation domain-containing protein [Nitrospirota bacterium]
MRNSKINKSVHCSLFTVHCCKGFTFVELLISLVIIALATSAVYTSFIVQQRTFMSQDQLAETQVSSKIAFDMMSNDIRNAGFGYPADENPSINGSTGLITINNNAGANNSDTITVIAGFNQIATLSADAVVGQSTISISYTGSTLFDISTKRYLSVDGLDFAQINSCTIPGGSSGCSSSSPLTLDRNINKPFVSGRPVYLVEAITYQKISSGDLQRVTGSSADVVANNIDDLQAVSIDQDGDGNPTPPALPLKTAVP